MQRWLGLLALSPAAVLAAAIEPIAYAELLEFQEDSDFMWANFSSWTAPHGGSTYCAAPIAMAGEERIDVYAVGYDCCADGEFACFRDTKVYKADPGAQVADAERDVRVGLKVDRHERQFFLKAAKKSSVYWKGGRQEWTPPPLVVYLVPQTINHCSTEELSVCGDGRNKDSCPPPVKMAYDLGCPKLEKCYRQWNQNMELYHHVCIPRPFRERFIPSDEDSPDWWDKFKDKAGPNHPNRPGSKESNGRRSGAWPPASRDDVYARDEGPGGKWQSPEEGKWTEVAEAPEWSAPGASPKWRRPSGEMWEGSGQGATALLRGKRRPHAQHAAVHGAPDSRPIAAVERSQPRPQPPSKSELLRGRRKPVAQHVAVHGTTDSRPLRERSSK